MSEFLQFAENIICEMQKFAAAHVCTLSADYLKICNRANPWQETCNVLDEFDQQW